jgi:multicomponent Na+:H+ antiporter subunit E
MAERYSTGAMARKLGSRAPAALLHAAVFAGLWWVLAGDRPSSWALGLPGVLAAVVAAAAVRREPARPSPAGVVRFLLYFLWTSLRAGLDVARRVLLPAMPIDPEPRRYRLRLPHGPARVFLAAVTSLLPGTLSLEIEGDELLLHALDARVDLDRELAVLEARVADLFAVDLSAGAGDIHV